MAEFRDIMGIGFPKEFVPYEIEDGWVVVLPGEEDGRRGDKRVVAISHVHIKLFSQEERDECIKHLEESDRRLRLMKSNPWDWQRVMIRDNEIKFGVAWYDRSFFEQKKESWADSSHTQLYSAFGATEDNFSVQHELLE